MQPLIELPYNTETNTEQFTEIRLSYIRGLRSLLVLALCVRLSCLKFTYGLTAYSDLFATLVSPTSYRELL